MMNNQSLEGKVPVRATTAQGMRAQSHINLGNRRSKQPKRGINKSVRRDGRQSSVDNYMQQS